MRVFSFLFAGLIGLAVTVPASAQNSVDRGKALVTQYCSGCHEVGLDGDSPHPSAPPFRKLSERFPIDALEETFIESIDTGHPGMPVFSVSQDQIDTIIDYIARVME